MDEKVLAKGYWWEAEIQVNGQRLKDKGFYEI